MRGPLLLPCTQGQSDTEDRRKGGDCFSDREMWVRVTVYFRRGLQSNGSFAPRQLEECRSANVVTSPIASRDRKGRERKDNVYIQQGKQDPSRRERIIKSLEKASVGFSLPRARKNKQAMAPAGPSI